MSPALQRPPVLAINPPEGRLGIEILFDPQKRAANVTSLVVDHHHRRILLAEFHKRI
jgi:hypothetical protein